jgi:hypothetical protein
MPCPFFEPTRVTDTPTHLNARLPLLQEYDGVCCAADTKMAVPGELRFKCCNHGYAASECSVRPANSRMSANRFSVLSRSDVGLEIVCVEESQFAPVRHFVLRYSTVLQSFEVPVTEPCLASQARAFCESYLRLSEQH